MTGKECQKALEEGTWCVYTPLEWEPWTGGLVRVIAKFSWVVWKMQQGNFEYPVNRRQLRIATPQELLVME